MNKQGRACLILGAGGHGAVIAEIATASGWRVHGFLDDGKALGTRVLDVPVLGPLSAAADFPDCFSVLAIGDNHLRRALSEQLPLKWATLVHPSAVTSSSAKLGEGTVVMAGVVVNARAEIGRHCILNTGCIVEHDNRIASFVHLSPRAVLGGTVSIGEASHIGLGASVRNNCLIGADATVGVGSAVVSDLVEPGVYVGAPAHKVLERA